MERRLRVSSERGGTLGRRHIMRHHFVREKNDWRLDWRGVVMAIILCFLGTAVIRIFFHRMLGPWPSSLTSYMFWGW